MNWLKQLLPKDTSAPAIRGGLRLARNKPGLPDDCSIQSLTVPDEIVIPLVNYQQIASNPMVCTGQSVTVGQKLASDIISPATGFVIGIENRPIIHPSSRSEQCVIIKPNSSQISTQAIYPPVSSLDTQRMAACALQGLGGAGFATAAKFEGALRYSTSVHPENSRPVIDTLIINAVECEPGISCDEALMMSEATSVIDAIIGLMTSSDCRRCILAVENDKLAALNALKQAISKLDRSEQHIELIPLAPVYPSGAERPLVERLTGISLADGRRAYEHGIACINVATALATWQAHLGYPLVARIVTVGGTQAQNPVNVRVLFGTRVRDVLQQTGNIENISAMRVRAGGPLSGFDLESLDAPITATTNCIAIEAPASLSLSQPCIRCSACSDVCPVDLIPQQLYWYASNDDLIKSAHYGLDSCIECGCCDVVCPSRIPLTQTFRHARHAQREHDRIKRVAAESEERYRLREIRVARRIAEREHKRQAARAKLALGVDPVSAALERARKKRKSTGSINKPGRSQ